MTATIASTLHQETLSLRHDELLRVLIQTPNLLIVQDLDGVCMGLVKDPLTRVMNVDYIKAARSLSPYFYVLTNGEHGGKRGVNRIVETSLEKAMGDGAIARQEGFYLPGLAAGGVQWQDRFGTIHHPGVMEKELEFLAHVPDRIGDRLSTFFDKHPDAMSSGTLQRCIQSATLDNRASPTANLNVFYEQLADRPALYGDLQQAMATLMAELLQDAAQQGMADSFFVHYAPNLGRDKNGMEILRPVSNTDSGTTDFQFMLRGAVKEAGVVAILNHYYHQRTGSYPLGKEFSARQAPQSREALLDLVVKNFSREDMPLIVGVGDTVNSTVEFRDGKPVVRRGGSDRNFLQLVQDIGSEMDLGHIITYVDSSGGEVLNRKPLQVEAVTAQDGSNHPRVIEGPCDPDDKNDPLQLNVVFPGGHKQYIALFQQAARQRSQQ